MIPDKIKILNADVWAFDNDGTLYDTHLEVENAIKNLMIQYIATHYGICEKSAIKKRCALLKKYNTKYTLIALKKDGVCEDDFIQKTYLSIQPSDFGIYPSVHLKELLSSLSGDKIVLTNNPSEFAKLILSALEIENFFSQIIGMREMNYAQKPAVEAFQFLIDQLNKGKRVALIDDCKENIDVAQRIGCDICLAKL